MLARHFIMTAVFVAATATFFGYSAHSAEQPEVVDFRASVPAPTVTNLDATIAAHAEAHGLTDCVTPDMADLDSVILTVPTDVNGYATSTSVTVVTFDDALDSAGTRRNVLACKQ